MLLIDVLNQTKCLTEYIDLIKNNLDFIALKKGKDVYLANKDIWIQCRRDADRWQLLLCDERAYSMQVFKIKKNTQLECFKALLDFIELKNTTARI